MSTKNEENKVNLREILSISGHSQLFKYIAQARNGIIAEAIVDNNRMAFGGDAKVSSLGDISIYTNDDEMPLQTVLDKMKEKEGGEAIKIDIKKATPDEIKSYFAQIVPDYDSDRCYVSHIKKMIDWYNQLQRANMLDFVEEKKAEENDENPKDEEKK